MLRNKKKDVLNKISANMHSFIDSFAQDKVLDIIQVSENNTKMATTK